MCTGQHRRSRQRPAPAAHAPPLPSPPEPQARKTFKRGPFHLGALSVPIGVTAVLWVCFLTVRWPLGGLAPRAHWQAHTVALPRRPSNAPPCSPAPPQVIFVLPTVYPVTKENLNYAGKGPGWLLEVAAGEAPTAGPLRAACPLHNLRPARPPPPHVGVAVAVVLVFSVGWWVLPFGWGARHWFTGPRDLVHGAPACLQLGAPLGPAPVVSCRCRRPRTAALVLASPTCCPLWSPNPVPSTLSHPVATTPCAAGPLVAQDSAYIAAQVQEGDSIVERLGKQIPVVA